MLKLDPKNTELLSQKQKVLNENIQTTEEKLKQLKEIKAKADEAMAKGTEINEQNYRNLQREIIQTENKLKQMNLEASKWTQISGKLSELSSKMKAFGDAVTSAGKKVSVLSGAVASLFGVGVKYNAEIEKSTQAFKTFIGSAEGAEKAIENIKKQSINSPFDTKELIRANQMLITTGENSEDSRKTISALADAIALTGGGNDELSRMAANLQQIKNIGKASSTDIKQFGMAGIDIYGILAETTGKNVEELKKMGVNLAFVTLHVGAGTFQPVREDDILNHHMHSEFYQVTQEAADLINDTKAAGGRVICVGTTSCRTVESAANEEGKVVAGCDNTEIFIYPGYKFKVLDNLITNFHLPESTLIMLVSALAGKEQVLNAYKTAVEMRYRFFSFGDAMFIQ